MLRHHFFSMDAERADKKLTSDDFMTAAIDVRPAPSGRGDQSDSRTRDIVIADALDIMLWIGTSLQIDHGVKRPN